MEMTEGQCKAGDHVWKAFKNCDEFDRWTEYDCTVKGCGVTTQFPEDYEEEDDDDL